MINCAADVGTCHSGYYGKVYPWVKEHGITDESCAPYEAVERECNDMGWCRECLPHIGVSCCVSSQLRF